MADKVAMSADARWPSIERAADALLGRTFGDIATDDRDFSKPILRSKSLLGDIVQEDYFNI